MTYVFDDRAIAEVFVLRPGREFVVQITDMVEHDRVTFPNDVLTAMKYRYDASDIGVIWAIAVKKSRFNAAVPWDARQDVLDAYPEMVDENTVHDPCGPAVLAQARDLSEHLSVTIVSEDWGIKPGRMALATACEHDAKRCICAADWLSEVGL